MNTAQAQINYDAITPEELSGILSQLFQPNTEVIKQATAVLKEYIQFHNRLGMKFLCVDTFQFYFKRIRALENLLILMSTSPEQNIRQVSCIYLRKTIGNLWMNLAKENQEKTKQLLLQRFVEEPVPILKKNIADVIGSLGKILIPNKEWNELFQFFFQYSNSQQLIDKELAMVLLSVTDQI